MPSQSECRELLKRYGLCAQDRRHNAQIIQILEGDLLPIVEDHIKREFSDTTFEQIRHRISPINFLNRIVDKLSKIYCQRPARVVADGNENDQALLDWYVNCTRVDTVMHQANIYYNSFNATLVNLYVANGKPKLRTVPNDRFWAEGCDPLDPTVPTKFILENGCREAADGRVVDTFRVYTAEEEYVIDSDGKAYTLPDNPEGINPFGTLDGLFLYVNKSFTKVVPSVDSDTLRMTCLIAILLSDLNYAIKFQAFSILYTKNAEVEGITLAPNALVHLKSDKGSDKDPELGQIKPQVDIPQVLEHVKTMLTMWLNSKNIRPGSVSDISADNAASGFSKVVDEMDTSEERKKQAEVFSYAESEFWHNVMHVIHPELVRQGLLNRSDLFTPNATVDVSFHEQLPTMRRGQMVADLSSEVQAGFVSVETAIRKLNPEWSDERIEEELARIESRREIEIGGTAESDNQDT